MPLSRPKTAGGMNQFVVGALDEDSVMHTLVGRVEMRAFYLADHKVFIQNGAADVEDAVVFCRSNSGAGRFDR